MNTYATRELAVVLGLALTAGCGEGIRVQEEELEIVSVDPDRELLITDVSVVEDPVRTVYRAAPTSPAQGAWSFGRLIENMAGAQDPSAFVLAWLSKWEKDQVVKPQDAIAPARPYIRTVVTDPWLIASGCKAGAKACKLDFSKAPFRLTAIVNRLDKRDKPDPQGNISDAGEGRFVFNVLNAAGGSAVFTVIFEYALPASTPSQVFAWAQRWHALGQVPFGDSYNSALQQVTDGFSGKGVAPGRINGNALNALRINEVSLAAEGTDPTNLPSTKLWEIRSSKLSADGSLKLQAVAQTPRLSYSGTTALADWLNANAARVLNGTHVVPLAWLDATSPTPSALAWTAPGADPEVVHQFAINTCSGCHRSETATAFLHIGRRNPGERVTLSAWLTGTEMPRRVNDFALLLSVNSLSAAGDTLPARQTRGH